jgi:DNA-binding IclR family transcriptional regulator
LLAYQDDAFLETYFAETQLRAYTDKTLVRKDEILAHLSEVRNSGVAETREEIVAGVIGFGAPIFDRNERILAAVLIAAPVDRALARRAKLIELTRGAGSEMSQILGYTGLYPPPTHQAPDPRA